MTKYKVEKLVDGNWYLWDIFSNARHACFACFELGKNGVEDVRVTEIRDGE